MKRRAGSGVGVRERLSEARPGGGMRILAKKVYKWEAVNHVGHAWSADRFSWNRGQGGEQRMGRKP